MIASQVTSTKSPNTLPLLLTITGSGPVRSMTVRPMTPEPVTERPSCCCSTGTPFGNSGRSGPTSRHVQVAPVVAFVTT